MFIAEAFILGLLVALNPCQLAINVSALTYLNQRCGAPTELMRQAIIYAIGRMATYTLLAIVLMIIWQHSSGIDKVQQLLSQGEVLLPYILIIIGVYMIIRVFHHHNHHGDDCHNCGQTIRRSGPSGALVLGLMLAFAFCPESAVIYFGLMMPLAITHSMGVLAPLAFAIASVMPIILIAALMSKAEQRVKAFTRKFSHFQQMLNAIIGIAFIAAAIILAVK